jgi:hypothetical protein
MINQNRNCVMFWVYVVVASTVITMLSSCSTRKVIIEEVKKDSISETVVKTATVEDIKIETKNDIVIDEFTITPLDTCKDIVIDGKTYRNVTINYKKTKDNTIQVQDIKVSKKELKVQDTKVTQNRKVKDIEKTPIPQLWLLWLLLPIGLWVFYKFRFK